MASQEYGCSGAKWEKGEYDSLEFCFWGNYRFHLACLIWCLLKLPIFLYSCFLIYLFFIILDTKCCCACVETSQPSNDHLCWLIIWGNSQWAASFSVKEKEKLWVQFLLEFFPRLWYQLIYHAMTTSHSRIKEQNTVPPPLHHAGCCLAQRCQFSFKRFVGSS
jgi:hypothetical protein